MFNKKDSLKVFFNEPDREVAVREYARMCNIAPATAAKHLQQFVQQGLLVSRKERNLVLFKANEESDAYKDLKKYENIRLIRESRLLEHLIIKLQYPLAIFLFGSYAKAENRIGSDIDLFIITRTKKKIDTKIYEKKLNAPIQLFIYTPKEVHKLKKTNPHLLNNILNGVRLYGFWEAL